MEGFYVVFDRENVQVGFAATTCGGISWAVCFTKNPLFSPFSRLDACLTRLDAT